MSSLTQPKNVLDTCHMSCTILSFQSVLIFYGWSFYQSLRMKWENTSRVIPLNGFRSALLHPRSSDMLNRNSGVCALGWCHTALLSNCDIQNYNSDKTQACPSLGKEQGTGNQNAISHQKMHCFNIIHDNEADSKFLGLGWMNLSNFRIRDS